ncbi:hypothetical protein CVT26_011742 [Gymnopilus dilepis]|uniref:Uncharacterized protein n=1 Tax=Gymnopilus dilepis TaxID=231916 RepID=A0A409W5S7_9AGAR|nr:hypothetical protein CVT26_011742 [Gymnopilus dilepis]
MSLETSSGTWIPLCPRTLLPHITLRNFLDKVQEKLAFAAGLIPDFPDPSRQGSTLWRKRLSGDPPHRNTDAERLATARELFQGLGSANASRALVLLNSSGAQLTTKLSSEIRRRGDAVAHGPLSKRDIVMAIEDSSLHRPGTIYEMTHKDESESFTKRPGCQKKKAPPPSEQRRAPRRSRQTGCLAAISDIDEAALIRHLMHENMLLRDMLQAKDLDIRLGCRISLSHAKGKAIDDLKQEKDVLQRQLDGREKEVACVRSELKEAEAAIAILKEEMLEEGASREIMIKQLAKVTARFQKVQTELARVKLRNLVDKVQARLETLTKNPISPTGNALQRSLDWRKRLDKKKCSNDKERMQRALSLFEASRDRPTIEGAAFNLLNSASGHLLTDNFNRLRRAGDDVAHGPLCLADITEAVEAIDLTAEEMEGVELMADFIGLY